jgi:hypothetical protein
VLIGIAFTGLLSPSSGAGRLHHPGDERLGRRLFHGFDVI